VSLVCVFDVNETLLDLAALDPTFERVFGRAGVRREWFAQLLQSAMVTTITNAYEDFGAIGNAALGMIAQRHGVELATADRDAILGSMRTLPPHPEVPGALARLQVAGIRMAALTNSTEDVARAQLTHAELAGSFERILSADTVRRLKPAPDAYRMAARELGEDIGAIRLIAAHAWDVAGAMRAGASAAFVARPGMVLDPLAPRPEIIGTDLGEVIDQILAGDARR
jgi:2-haloacid dehalogenase